jgi:hypothetical protein
VLGITLGGVYQALAQHVEIGPIGAKFTGSRKTSQQYDPQTVTTVAGQVESTGSYGLKGWRIAPGMETQGLILRIDKEIITVDLGPAWYVNQKDFHIKAGDILEVTGSKITRNDETIILATEAKQDGKTLRVRDEKGSPLWKEQSKGGRGPKSQFITPRGGFGLH